MIDLPVFPLTTVLFPGMPLPLYIFEERYKKMVAYCQESGDPFIVSLIQEGMEALGNLAKPHSIGTKTVIHRITELEDGRFNLMTRGTERVRIVSTNVRDEYLIGQIENFPFDAAQNFEESKIAQLRTLTLEMIHFASGREDGVRLPENSRELIFFCAGVLPVPMTVKQSLLEKETSAQLLEEILELTARQIAIMKTVKNRNPPDAHLN